MSDLSRYETPIIEGVRDIYAADVAALVDEGTANAAFMVRDYARFAVQYGRELQRRQGGNLSVGKVAYEHHDC